MIKINLYYPIRLFNNWKIYLNKKKFVITISYLKYTKFNKIFKTLINLIILKRNIDQKIKKANTLTTSLVKKSKKKIRQQKKTGKARLGSLKSSLVKGGGTTFGPVFHIKHLKINKNQLKIILNYLLFNKRSNIFIIFTFNIFKSNINLKNYLKFNLILNGIITKKNIYYLFLFKHNFYSLNNFNYYKLLYKDYIILFI